MMKMYWSKSSSKVKTKKEVEEQTHGLSRGELWAIYERDQKWVKMNQKKVRICALYDDVIKPSSKEKDQNGANFYKLFSLLHLS